MPSLWRPLHRLHRLAGHGRDARGDGEVRSRRDKVQREPMRRAGEVDLNNDLAPRSFRDQQLIGEDVAAERPRRGRWSWSGGTFRPQADIAWRSRLSIVAESTA